MTKERLLRGLLVAGLCAAMVGLVAARPSAQQSNGPIVRSGDVGETVRGVTMQYRATRVQVGTALVESGFSESKHPATGFAFVVVRGELLATEEAPVSLKPELRDDADRRFRPVDEIGETLTSRTAHPGIPVTGDVVFQVPRSAVPGVDLVMAFEDAPPFPEQVRIDLGLEPSDVKDGVVRSHEARYG